MIATQVEKARAALVPKRVVSAFHAFLLTENGKVFLVWLADACHANETVARETQSETDRAIGRNQVWHMVCQILRITNQDLDEAQAFVANLRE